MSKQNVALANQDDLLIVLRRMTTKALMEMREATGETDFTDTPNAFYFSNRAIAAEVNGCSREVANLIQDSDLDYVHRGSEILVWLDDLEERLERFANQE
ncbi:hypothetical protein LIX82_001818 [Vibrio parahaemolyticus]|uniref:hypothetical protein n=1 Tax=Vibrio TaxID=662 RepID=UPI000410C70A|nr:MULTISPECIES: hypothetical protein [Vibrio]EGQ7681763.1 hypothetical protein [Vibrio parahaemolyticus]EGQ9493602.1 hypothetical protein [Vibrio parahaemolyticus]EGR0375115.1 hypothetical protein [Vibrio parahaemolyticus]EGR0696826.1 hypothetical protein [Vibrio parahaemolyticus]EGR0913776.1 hypothetical protein [Vibrio parahaemolyticus]